MKPNEQTYLTQAKEIKWDSVGLRSIAEHRTFPTTRTFN